MFNFNISILNVILLKVLVVLLCGFINFSIYSFVHLYLIKGNNLTMQVTIII